MCTILIEVFDFLGVFFKVVVVVVIEVVVDAPDKIGGSIISAIHSLRLKLSGTNGVTTLVELGGRNKLVV